MKLSRKRTFHHFTYKSFSLLHENCPWNVIVLTFMMEPSTACHTLSHLCWSTFWHLANTEEGDSYRMCDGYTWPFTCFWKWLCRIHMLWRPHEGHSHHCSLADPQPWSHDQLWFLGIHGGSYLTLTSVVTIPGDHTRCTVIIIIYTQATCFVVDSQHQWQWPVCKVWICLLLPSKMYS